MNNTIKPEDIQKWIDKIEPEIQKIEPSSASAQSMLENMKAYVADSKHFLETGDLVRSFEAIIWAWAILEICKDLGVF
ncbi:MAG: DUF357 domain-containing protein [Candidatus Aenigmatarchaeota archaeon]|nr:DUF357 domain-containing protein [Candidatus Aenigmarchaeota archaeon]